MPWRHDFVMSFKSPKQACHFKDTNQLKFCQSMFCPVKLFLSGNKHTKVHW